MLYLGMSVLILLDRSYSSRFWTNYEAWLSMQPEGAAHLHDGGLYQGRLPASPTIGDVRISFELVKPGPVSVVSKQTGSTFTPYTTSNGRIVDLVASGNVPAESMFDQAQQTIVSGQLFNDF